MYVGPSRIDVCEAWYLFLNNSYKGQGCPLYARLSRLTRFFKPSYSLTYRTATPEARKIYRSLSLGRTISHYKKAA